MKLTIKRFAVITGQPMYGRIFAVQREGRTVMKVAVVPGIGQDDKTIAEYMVRLSVAPEPTLMMPAEQALELSQVLSTAYSHARRLENRYLGKPVSRNELLKKLHQG